MLGTALYFPHIDIHEPDWLRSAILFWDEIQTIAPSAIEEPYQNEDTKICSEEGYLKPLRCDLHPSVIDELGRKIIRLADDRSEIVGGATLAEHPSFETLKQANWAGREIEDAFEEVGIHPDKMSPEVRELAFRYGLSQMHKGKIPPYLRHAMRGMEMARMHPNKMPSVMRDLFRHNELYTDHETEWLLVDSRFADAYMSALAAELCQKLQLSPLTHRESAQGMSFRFMFDDMLDSSPRHANGAVLGVIMRGLKVDASVPVAKLIRFREARKDQYLDFAAKIAEMEGQLHMEPEDTGEELFQQARTIYQQKIEPSLRSLKRELEHQSISSVWSGAYRALTVSVPSAGALAYFTGLTGPALLGAGAALAAADIGVRSYLAGQNVRSASPYSYLHDIKANFGLPEFVD